MYPSIAQLVERWTVEVTSVEIHRSLVQIRLEGRETFFTIRRLVQTGCGPRSDRVQLTSNVFVLYARRNGLSRGQQNASPPPQRRHHHRSGQHFGRHFSRHRLWLRKFTF